MGGEVKGRLEVNGYGLKVEWGGGGKGRLEVKAEGLEVK